MCYELQKNALASIALLRASMPDDLLQQSFLVPSFRVTKILLLNVELKMKVYIKIAAFLVIEYVHNVHSKI